VMKHSAMMLRAWFSPGTDEIVTATHQNDLTTWRLERVPVPEPEWLPDLAEALAGHSLASDGSLVPVDEGFFQRFDRELLADSSGTRHGTWANRFQILKVNATNQFRGPNGSEGGE